MQPWIRISLVAASVVAMAQISSVVIAAGEGAQWGARDPVTTCADITSKALPPVAALQGLVRCEREEITYTDELWLVEGLSIKVGKSRSYQGRNEFMTMPDADTTKPVYPIQGSWTWVACRDPKAVARTGGDPALNCSQAVVAKAQGACWKTTFGTWRCNMSGPTGAMRQGFAPPK